LFVGSASELYRAVYSVKINKVGEKIGIAAWDSDLWIAKNSFLVKDDSFKLLYA
jgi:hypothetical protein